jgi:hypothetical protein
MERAITWLALYSLAQVPAAQSQLPHFPPFSFAHVPAKLPQTIINMGSKNSCKWYLLL